MNDAAHPAGQVQQGQSRSPLYEALNQARYHRQSIIRAIEDNTKRRLIIYYANIQHLASGISAVDVAPFHELVMDCDQDSDIDLILQTPGGDADAAEKLVIMLRSRAKSFRLIVPERAKSAGTLMAMAADEIVMSISSELGPIDPQITINQPDGKVLNRPAQSFLDGLELIKKDVVSNNGQINAAFFPLLSQLDPALLDYCTKTIERSKAFARKWLCNYMLKNDHAKAAAVAEKLADVRQYSSHGMVIDAAEAAKLGLNINQMPSDDPLWRLIWNLHLAYDVATRMAHPMPAKLFESRKVSVVY
jgi:ATP-dependent protease ClpP protease subunit